MNIIYPIILSNIFTQQNPGKDNKSDPDIDRIEILADGSKVIFYEETAAIKSLGLTNHDKKEILISKKNCRDQLLSRLFINPQMNLITTAYGITGNNNLDPFLQAQMVDDLAECVKNHELRHLSYDHSILRYFQQFYGIGKPLDVLLELDADLNIITNLIALSKTDRCKAQRLCLLWAFKAITEDYLDRRIIALIVLSCLDKLAAGLSVDFRKLERLTTQINQLMKKTLENIIVSIKGFVKCNYNSNSRSDWAQEEDLIVNAFKQELNYPSPIPQSIFLACSTDALSFIHDLIPLPEISGNQQLDIPSPNLKIFKGLIEDLIGQNIRRVLWK